VLKQIVALRDRYMAELTHRNFYAVGSCTSPRKVRHVFQITLYVDSRSRFVCRVGERIEAHPVAWLRNRNFQGVEKGRGRIAKCLRDNKDRLGEACKADIEDLMAQMKERREERRGKGRGERPGNQ
jgi:hypothetical protein